MKEQLKLQHYIEKGKPLKIKKLSSFFKQNPEDGANVLEHTTNFLILEKPTTHNSLSELYRFLLYSKDSMWFSLYFECLLANETLYLLLMRTFGFKSHEDFYHEMLRLAETHPDRDAKDTGLAILLVLYDSFSEKLLDPGI